MSSFMYTNARTLIDTNVIIPTSDILKIGLFNGNYSPSKADLIIPASSEILVTAYNRGWHASGRKTAAPTIANDLTNFRTWWILPTLTWSPLGGVTNDTVTYAILLKEGTSNDSTSIPIICWQLTPVTTNGSNYQLLMDQTNGNYYAQS